MIRCALLATHLEGAGLHLRGEGLVAAVGGFGKSFGKPKLLRPGEPEIRAFRHVEVAHRHSDDLTTRQLPRFGHRRHRLGERRLGAPAQQHGSGEDGGGEGVTHPHPILLLAPASAGAVERQGGGVS